MYQFTADDRYLFHEGTHKQLYNKFGAQVIRNQSEIIGTQFTVYAPHAKKVSVVGNFNHWNGQGYEMTRENGIWSIFIPNLLPGECYKYEIVTAFGEIILKADPYAFYAEQRPNTASIVYDLEGFNWTDEAWINKRQSSNLFE